MVQLKINEVVVVAGDVEVNIFVWLSVGSVNEHLRESSGAQLKESQASRKESNHTAVWSAATER